jgi:hypothetical protein
MVPKAQAGDFPGRFREIISDPLNVMIERHPKAGFVEDGMVYLHNGNRVAVSGPYAYYGGFSTILMLNRGVHEPLEEYVFQKVMAIVGEKPTMIELGAYWGHYSMWLKQRRPQARTILVEPMEANLAVGRENFRINGFQAEFIQDFVDAGRFGIDAFMAENGIDHLDILHSDVQGYEDQMLDGARQALTAHKVDYLFVSTHSQALHAGVKARLEAHGYRIEADSDFENESTSYDGLVFASSPNVDPVLPDFRCLHRAEINAAGPLEILSMLAVIAGKDYNF